MDRDQAGQRPLTVAEAKARLQEDFKLLPASVADPLEWVRKHPKEAVIAAALTGIVLGTMPRLRRSIFALAVDVARVVIK